MQINNQQQDVFTRISKTPDGKELINFLRNLIASTGDVRKIVDISVESVKGRQLACSIIEDEILSRFTTTSKDGINKEEYE